MLQQPSALFSTPGFRKGAAGSAVFAALVLSVAAFMFAATQAASPCAAHAQTSCNVGDDETFTGSATFEADVTFEDQINIGATPGPGSEGAHIVSTGASAPEWSLFIVKPADETVNNSSTLQNDDDLAFTVAANATYRVDATLLLDTDTVPDFKFQWSLPASATIDGIADFDVTGASGIARDTFSEAASMTIQGDGSGNLITLTFQGLLITAGTAGTAQFQWAQQAANVSDTDLKAGTWIELTRIS